MENVQIAEQKAN